MNKNVIVIVLSGIVLTLLSSKSYFSCVATKKEKTLAMIKPDGVSGNFTDQIKNMILESGFNIVREKMLQLNEEKVALFYAEHSGRSFFTDLVKYMSRYSLFHFIYCTCLCLHLHHFSPDVIILCP